MAQKVWGGRFKGEVDDLVDRFNSSIDFDRRLYREDIDGSVAHCRMMAARGIIGEDEASSIVEALGAIKREIERGELSVEGYEDIHSLVEKVLVEKVGALGEKLHTGRSRNDQVALVMRMHVRSRAERALELMNETRKALVQLSERNIDVVMPGYTHLQRAQPVLAAHHLMAYYEMISRDVERFRQCVARANVMPLGSAALSGSTFDLDRSMVAAELGFQSVTSNSMDAVSDRDFVLDFMYASSVLCMHLSRLSEELILWATTEFGFISISDSFCTGSSIMPQKKNPDVPELVRGKAGRVFGHLVGLLTTMKGLPLAYNKDMQEDKEALFDTADTVEMCLEVMARLLPEITFNRERLMKAAGEGYLVATDLADYLVRKGLTFRGAHEVSGKMVLYAIERSLELHQLTIREMKKFSQHIEEDVYEWLEPESCVRRRTIAGGTGFETVAENLRLAKKELGL